VGGIGDQVYDPRTTLLACGGIQRVARRNEFAATK
jgi:hypothetical protein